MGPDLSDRRRGTSAHACAHLGLREVCLELLGAAHKQLLGVAELHGVVRLRLGVLHVELHFLPSMTHTVDARCGRWGGARTCSSLI
jgi:hypothetical protein